MTEHDDLVEQYVRSQSSPDGEWWLNVPVGFEFENHAETLYNSLKEIDAVCLTSRPSRLPLEYEFEQSPAEFVTPVQRPIKRYYREMHANSEFAGEPAVLVEVKTGAPDLKAIGQLMAYQELFENDWRATVTERTLAAKETDVAIEWVCDRLSIGVVQI